MKFEPRILVVEDDELVGELFCELLPANGIQVELVVDAESAMEALQRQHYDLVVADKNLPGKSGIDLLRFIKQTGSELDVIIMTAYADMRSVLAAVESGVYDYLCKPFESIDDVVQKISRALEKRRILLENRRLVEYLTQANSQIESMNRDLEAKVAERTRQLREANAKLEELSMTDDVTGLHNQRFLFMRMEEELRRARRHEHGLAVIMLDIDNFKETNDEHDHLFGSRVLQRLGEILRQNCRSIDMIARYGGDEFCVLMPNTRLAEAVVVAERMRAAVEVSNVGDQEEGEWKVSVSLGVAALGESEGDSPRSLLRAADRALYVAKSQGRNRVAVMEGSRPVAVVAALR